MEDKKFATALLLSIIVIMLYSQVFLPVPTPPLQPTPTPSASGPGLPALPQTPGTALPPPPQLDREAPVLLPPAEQQAAAPKTLVESNLIKLGINHLGGRIESLQLKGYRAQRDQPDLMDLVAIRDGIAPLGVYAAGINDAAALYTLSGISVAADENGTYRVPADGSLSLNMQGELPGGIAVTKTITLWDQSYLLQVQVALAAPAPDGSPLWLEWAESLSPKGDEESWNPRTFTLFDNAGAIENIDPSSLRDTPLNRAVRWASLGNNYFTVILIPAAKGTNTNIAKTGSTVLLRSRGEAQQGSFEIFAGPKLRSALEAPGYHLERSINLGWFAFIGQPLLLAINWFYSFLGNYGLAIVLLTLIVKFLLLPLTATSFKSMKRMQDLQPQIMELRKRIKDPAQLNQEMMALWKKNNVNPLGGCFPILLQLPVFLGMYNALRVSPELRHEPFALWINDLSAPEHLDILGIPIPVMIIIMGLSMLATQLTTPSTLDPAQQRIMLLLPVIFTIMFIIFPFPSGLVLYWLISNLISIVQQVVLRSDKGYSPYQATVVGSIVIFAFSYVITLI